MEALLIDVRDQFCLGGGGGGAEVHLAPETTGVALILFAFLPVNGHLNNYVWGVGGAAAPPPPHLILLWPYLTKFENTVYLFLYYNNSSTCYCVSVQCCRERQDPVPQPASTGHSVHLIGKDAQKRLESTAENKSQVTVIN